MSLWAVAKLGFHPGRMLAEFGARIEEIRQEFLPQACSNTLWALAVLQVCRPCNMCHQGACRSLCDVILNDNRRHGQTPPAPSRNPPLGRKGLFMPLAVAI